MRKAGIVQSNSRVEQDLTGIGRPQRGFYLVAPPVSLNTVGNFVDFLCGVVAEHSKTRLQVLPYDGKALSLPSRGVVFAVGQSLPPMEKSYQAFTVFLNFSVVYHLRPWPFHSLRAKTLVGQKRRRFLDRLPGIDLILDFYPTHGERLRKLFPEKYGGSFPVAVYSRRVPFIPSGCASFDVCAIGSETRRRRLVWRSLAAEGLSISPTHGQLSEVLPCCRVTANVHSERYDNYELHRIVSSLAYGRPVVSEFIFGEQGLRSWPGLHLCSFRRVKGQLVKLVRQSELEKMSRQAYDFYWDAYWPAAREKWCTIIDEISRRAALKFGARW
jgi:hypothetical protein